eukprot:CAMPEP_0175307246 /NCGR_PEP_ID=MMETSP0093-20121207/64668_1 /TAXON_ID=311494 /ORGANISM="Alexandrium monilatum, Strain CCMP3105" /LENGTH=91 /DNA_ID=CAMNT_0016603713 /DNA_START=160 /DNA_END=435 /DNA_ORIENTATION=+
MAAAAEGAALVGVEDNLRRHGSCCRRTRTLKDGTTTVDYCREAWDCGDSPRPETTYKKMIDDSNCGRFDNSKGQKRWQWKVKECCVLTRRC